MRFVTKNLLLSLGILAGVGAVAIAGVVWSGVYNVAADDLHTRPVHALLQTVRERSIRARSSRLEVPALADEARITQGAGNYNAMCMGCHLAPGMADTEMSKGLNPSPPNLTKATVDAAAAFWVIKHGIKASGMPAWGKSMEDQYIWNMVAFLQQLPKMTPEEYEATVARSGGHSHGGGETRPHDHGSGTPEAHHGDDASATSQGPTPTGSTTHVHADGKEHVHPASSPSTAPPAATPDSPKPSSVETPAAKPEVKPAAQPQTKPEAKPESNPEPEAVDHDAHEHHH